VNGENEVGFSNEPVGQAVPDLQAAYNLNKETPSQALPGGRALEQTYASGQQISPPDLTKMLGDMVTHSSSKVNDKTPETQSIQPAPPPESREDWLERLKRERRKRGWF